MIIPKKWMVVVSDEQYEWIKSTSDKADVSGAAVLRALITRAMEENSADFRRSLMSAQVKAELDALNTKKAQIAEREKELRLQLNGKDRVTA